jgi:hypothetical protein
VDTDRIFPQLTEEQEQLFRAVETAVNVADSPAWVCLNMDLEQRRALLITRDVVVKKAYNDNGKETSWEQCTLRKWLNGEFFDSLPVHITSHVVEVTNKNPKNEVYATLGGRATPGGRDTKDRVFLLSIGEAQTLLRYASGREAWNSGVGWWWLRSPGGSRMRAAYVGEDGNIDANGLALYFGFCGVRPAVWLSLDE